MTVWRTLARRWRESLLALVVALPWLSLVVLGMLWLWQGGHVLAWAGAALALGLVAWLLRWSLQANAIAGGQRIAGEEGKPTPGWNAAEIEAWAKVLVVADETPPLSFLDQGPFVEAAERAVAVVSGHFHPGASESWAHFTLPEALLLAERVARDIRREALRTLPGARTIRLDQVLWVRRFGERHGETARLTWKIGFGIWRVARLILNPLQSVALETKDLLFDQTTGFLSDRLRAYGTRLFVLEVGRAAIDLYAGRLTLSKEELESARTSDFATAETAEMQPIRILLAGQVNAGKSSLLNAMAQAMRSAVGPVPTTAGAREHLLTVEGRPAVVLVDTVGLGDGPDAPDVIAQEAERADLILWVASAVQPARAPDRACLDNVRAAIAARVARRPPPILLALTQVDQLRPASEWSPPYNVAAQSSPKARMIRAAMDAVSTTLAMPVDAIVPVALRPGEPAYNVDAVWARLALDLDEAQLVRLDRLRLSQNSLSLRELAGQIARMGLWVVKATVQPKPGEGPAPPARS